MPSDPPQPRPARVRNRGLLYGAETLSGLGDGVFWVGLIVAISDEPRFDALLALAVIVRLAPRALLSLPAGALVDRSNTRSVLLTSDLARAAVMTSLGAALQGGLDVRWAIPGVLLSYLLGVPNRPALAASLPSVVGESDLASATATISAIRQLMTFVGPLAGVAVAAWSVPGAFAFNGVAFAGAAVCVALVRGVRWPSSARRRHPSAQRTRSRPGAWIGEVDGLVTLVGLTAVMYTVRGAEIVLHVLVVRDVIETGPTAIGYLSGAVGLGAVIATPIARRIAADDRALVPLLTSLLLTAVPTALLALSGTVATAALLLVPVGAGMILFEVITVVTVQRAASAGELGRAFGALNTASNGGKLLGAVATPPIAAAAGTSTAIVVVSVVVAVAAIAASVPLRRLSDRAERRRAELEPVVAHLADLRLFAGAPQVGLERLAQHVTEHRVDAGAVLIREGAEPDDVYIVRSGEFDVTADGETVNRLGAGDWAGEIGLVEDLPRTATVTADTSGSVWRIPGGLFLAVLAGADDTSALDDDIARRLATGRSSASMR